MSKHVHRVRLLVFLLLASAAGPIGAQTIDDGIMVARGSLFTGTVYAHESWDQYWEGELKRRNGNVGEVTTTTTAWYANYGINNRLNVLTTVPFVTTNASQGVLHGINGFQDLTLAVKYNFLQQGSVTAGLLRAFVVVSAAIPLTDYNPELLPLSIGSGSTRVSWRGTLNYQSAPGWFVNGSAAYNWRSQVDLDRPYFFTDDEFVMSDRVDMPNAVDYVISAGYAKRRLMATASLTQQLTLSGGDIRRQDMPFVSNRMNVTTIGTMGMYQLPKLGDLWFQLGLGYTLNGRNVGQTTTVTTGLLYRFHWSSAQ